MVLKTERNSKTMEQRVKRAAKKAFKHYRKEGNKIYTAFEHGQWWVMFYDDSEDCQCSFSVCDAEGPGTYDGFSFEQV